jgi:hypothetical protein
MTKQLSAGDMKGTSKCSAYGKRPSPNTKIGDLYDALRRGEDIHHTDAHTKRRLAVLRDDYGMEFEHKRGPGGYIRLKGEWDGPYFVPIEHILQEDPNEE